MTTLYIVNDQSFSFIATHFAKCLQQLSSLQFAISLICHIIVFSWTQGMLSIFRFWICTNIPSERGAKRANVKLFHPFKVSNCFCFFFLFFANFTTTIQREHVTVEKVEIMHMLLNKLSHVHELLSTRIYPMSITWRLHFGNEFSRRKWKARHFAQPNSMCEIKKCQKYMGRVILSRLRTESVIFNIRESNSDQWTTELKMENWLKKMFYASPFKITFARILMRSTCTLDECDLLKV